MYATAYNTHIIKVLKSATFERWLRGLRDRQAIARINIRLEMVSLGHVGDAKSVGSGVSELRINYGPGYRVYFAHVRAEVIALLCGGDKDSQRRDIERAKRMATDWRRRHG